MDALRSSVRPRFRTNLEAVYYIYYLFGAHKSYSSLSEGSKQVMREGSTRTTTRFAPKVDEGRIGSALWNAERGKLGPAIRGELGEATPPPGMVFEKRLRSPLSGVAGRDSFAPLRLGDSGGVVSLGSGENAIALLMLIDLTQAVGEYTSGKLESAVDSPCTLR